MMSSERERISLWSISSLIEDTGFALCKHPRNTRILRLMQERINDLSKDVKSEDVIFITGFLNDYVERLWFNLAVDFSYEAGEIGKDLFDDLIQTVGTELQNLGKALREKDPQIRYTESFKASAKLTSIYREKLHELESKAKKIKLGVPPKVLNWDAVLPENRELYHAFDRYGVVYQSEHALAAGTESNYFFDVDRLLSTPDGIEVATKRYAEKIAEIKSDTGKVDKLAFIDKDIGTVGSLPLMSCVIAKTKIPGVIVRFRKEIPVGDVKCAFGYEPKKGEHVVIVSDVLTSGGGISKAARILSEYGAIVHYATVLYNRRQTEEKLKRIGIEVRSVATADELIKAYQIDTRKEQDFDSPGADSIPLAAWKTKKFEEEVGHEKLRRLENTRFASQKG